MADIKSSSNRLVKEYRLLKNAKHRKEKGRIILEGAILLEEALRAPLRVEQVLYTPSFARPAKHRELLDQAGEKVGEKRVVRVEESVFDSIAQTDNPQGVAAIARPPGHTAAFLKQPAPFFLILDGVQDPGNLGAILRSAAAANVDGAVLLPDTVDPYNPKALRASMGGTFFLPVVKAAGDFFEDRRLPLGLQLVAASPSGDCPHYQVDFLGPTAVVIGNESRGVSPKALARVHRKAFIPLQGPIASLNAAVAASIFIFEAIRQRESAVT